MYLFVPVFIFIGLILIGLSIISFTDKQKVGKILITVGVVFLYVSSTKYCSNSLLHTLEYRYPPLCTTEDSCDDIVGIQYIVVLLSSPVHDKAVPAEEQMSYPNLINLIEGIRLYNKITGVKLLFLGENMRHTTIMNARIMRNTAVSLGLDNMDIIDKHNFQNTYEAARSSKFTLTDTKFILVTSALHMPRAMGLFKGLGMDPVPAPTNHLVLPNDGFHVKELLPDSESLTICMVALFEYFGLIVDKILGRI